MSTSTSAADLPAQSGRDRTADPKWWTLAAVCLGVFMLLLDITIVNVALPDIQKDLSASLANLQWVIDAYALSLAALLLTFGSLADLFGRKRLYVVGIVIFTIGSAACGAAPTIGFLTYARAFQGIGGAAMFATALALIASAFHGRERGIAFGAFGATTGVAVAVGPVLGGALTSGLSWRWIFLVNVPLCLIAVVMTVLRVRESHDPQAGRPDLFGFVTFSLGLGALVYGLIEAGERGWGASRVSWSFVIAAVLLVVFVISQAAQRHPMFDLGLLRKPTFTGGLIAAFGVSASIFSLLAYLVIYVQNVLGYSAVGAGVRFLFLSLASFVAATLAGRASSFVPTKWLIAPGFLILGVGMLLLRGIHEDSAWTHLIPGLLVSGLAVGLINTPLASTAVGVVEPARSGMASGVNSTFRQVGIATGIATLGSIFAQRVTDIATPQLAGKVPAQYVDRLTSALAGGQVQAAADGAAQAASAHGGTAAGQQAHDLITRVGTSAIVQSLNHVLLLGAIVAFAAGVLCLFLIRQRDFVPHGPVPAGAGGAAPESAAGQVTAGQVTAGQATANQAADGQATDGPEAGAEPPAATSGGRHAGPPGPGSGPHRAGEHAG